MKHTKILATVAVLGLGMAAFAFHAHRGMKLHSSNDPELVAHISHVFKQFAGFDVNKDGNLDAAERESLAKALENGSFALPADMPPKEMFANEEQRLNHVVEMYPRFAAFDSDHNGELDATEQEALERAMENGQLGFPARSGSAAHHHLLPKSLHAR